MRLQMKSNAKTKCDITESYKTNLAPSFSKKTNQIEKEKKEKQVTERGEKRRLHNPCVTVHN